MESIGKTYHQCIKMCVTHRANVFPQNASAPVQGGNDGSDPELGLSPVSQSNVALRGYSVECWQHTRDPNYLGTMCKNVRTILSSKIKHSS